MDSDPIPPPSCRNGVRRGLTVTVIYFNFLFSVFVNTRIECVLWEKRVQIPSELVKSNEIISKCIIHRKNEEEQF